MARELSYSWYPKDWTFSDATFSLTLAERGLYRELIDLAMMNDNQVPLEWDLWVRKWNTDREELSSGMQKLESKGLIQVTDDKLFIPSCERRLVAKRNGRQGGLSTANGTPNGTAKSTPKEKEKENIIPTREDLEKHLRDKKRDDLDVDWLWNKIEAWKDNGWCDLNGNPIKLWKGKINSQFNYCPKVDKDDKFSAYRQKPKFI